MNTYFGKWQFLMISSLVISFTLLAGYFYIITRQSEFIAMLAMLILSLDLVMVFQIWTWEGLSKDYKMNWRKKIFLFHFLIVPMFYTRFFKNY
uniref:hypothetical protein n=1 Tax=Fulvivirga sp. TaxID=1931237 RepID=UPI0040492ACC